MALHGDSDTAPDVSAAPSCISGRFDVEALIARGGMAWVYRVRDRSTGQALALKWLDTSGSAEHVSRMTALLEREYQTLKQLSHPRVVACHDYGLHEQHPYYTMELLDGGDVRELAPLPWQEVCRIAYDVCSALSLLHSRRLIHLDLTPRNVRRTLDGKAKLIDFGLLAPMGVRAQASGTPAFLAPEVLSQISLDGRADLFSLGATMYYALTGRLAFPAQRMQQLHDTWRTKPIAPSRIVPDVPPALDALILSMIRADVGSRPKSAAEVMERLLPLMAAAPTDLPSITNAYLTIPQLVGRESIVERFRALLLRSLGRRGGGLVISGRAGIGRSRMLDAFALEAKLVGAVSLRAGAADALPGRFGAVAALVRQLLTALPEESAEALRSEPGIAELFEAGPVLTDLTRSQREPSALHSALQAFFLRVSARRALALAIDDLHLLDDASAAWLAGLASEIATQRITYVVTLAADAAMEAEAARDVLLAHAERIELAALSPEQLTSLLRSVFGEVSDLPLLSSRLYPLCAGRPRECMVLAKQLVDSGAITYANGSWYLGGSYAAGQLPATLGEALDRQVAQLSPAARHAFALLALGVLRSLRRHELQDAVLDELVGAQLVIGDGDAYTLCHEELAHRVLDAIDTRERYALHDDLAALYEAAQAEPLAIAYHQLSGSQPSRGLRLVLDMAADTTTWDAVLVRALTSMRLDAIGLTLELALREGERTGLCARDLMVLRERLAHQATNGQDPTYYFAAAPLCLERYKRDSGFDIWQTLNPALPALARAQQAITLAFERWQSTPELERVLSPPDAIKALARWVAISLPVSARTCDLDLTATQSELLIPFACISPLVDVIARNALAARRMRCECRLQEARQIWIDVVHDLETRSDVDVAYRTRILTTIHCVLGATDAMLGITSNWAERIEQREHDPTQLAQVFSVRKLLALSEGDWEGAEQHRRRADESRLRTRAHQVISTLIPELLVHAAARDLTGVKQVRSGIQAMAKKFANWLPVLSLADGMYERLCGDLEGALRSTDRALAQAEQRFPRWWMLPTAAVTRVELLIELERSSDALDEAAPLLARFRSGGVSHCARDLERAMALADAKLARFEAARARVERVIEEQLALGIGTMQLGLSYETAARVALLAHDAASFIRYSRLTAEHFQPGRSSVLGALYERLQEEARGVGLIESGQSLRAAAAGAAIGSESLTQRVSAVMQACQTQHERAQAALLLLCELHKSSDGMLFLLTQRGAVLCASTLGAIDEPELERAVHEFLSLELGRLSAVDSTQTLAALGADETFSPFTSWHGPDGRRCAPVLLRGEHEGRACVAGVAMLTPLSEPPTLLVEVTGMLTRYLLLDAETRPAWLDH